MSRLFARRSLPHSYRVIPKWHLEPLGIRVQRTTCRAISASDERFVWKYCYIKLHNCRVFVPTEKSLAISPIHPFNKYCIRDRKYGAYTSCCRGVVYDRRKNVCCNGIQALVPGYTGCCNGLLYSWKSHICCPDKIVRYKIYGSSSGCCGSTVYRFVIRMLNGRDVMSIVIGVDSRISETTGWSSPKNFSCLRPWIDSIAIGYDFRFCGCIVFISKRQERNSWKHITIQFCSTIKIKCTSQFVHRGNFLFIEGCIIQYFARKSSGLSVRISTIFWITYSIDVKNVEKQRGKNRYQFAWNSHSDSVEGEK